MIARPLAAVAWPVIGLDGRTREVALLCGLGGSLLRLLLLRLGLRFRVRPLDEALAAAPAEDPDHQDEREEDRPGRGDQLLCDRVGGRRLGVCDAVQRRGVERLVDAGPARVTATVFEIELLPTTDMTEWKVTGMA